jgi:methylenetetrahydrofolate dehydrogenase (NADP+)/methenyltetrahydrofolate cyclohydrolase
MTPDGSHQKKSTRRIEGRALAARIRADVAADISRLGIRPGLGVVLVGSDPASHLYVALKEKACLEAGIFFERRDFPEDAPLADVLNAVASFNADEAIDAMLVQLPLPKQLDTDAVVRLIDPKKDVDGFHPENLRAFLESTGRMPGLVEAISLLLDDGEAPSKGLACIKANSAIFSMPVEMMLERRGLAPTEDCHAADVVVTAIGKPRSLTADQLKPGAIVIDVGTSRVEGKTVGDADVESLEEYARALTPVPGGVGPMTVALLIKRTLELAKERRT